jgi:VanZ family protein
VLYVLPGNELPAFDDWDFLSLDKIAHIGLFSAMSLFLKVGLKRQSASAKARTFAGHIAVSFAISYGLILEVIQGQVAQGRYSDVQDALANVLGAILGTVIYRFIYRK